MRIVCISIDLRLSTCMSSSSCSYWLHCALDLHLRCLIVRFAFLKSYQGKTWKNQKTRRIFWDLAFSNKRVSGSQLQLLQPFADFHSIGTKKQRFSYPSSAPSFSSLAVQHLHLQSARTLLIFNETAKKEGFWYIFECICFHIYAFCMLFLHECICKLKHPKTPKFSFGRFLWDIQTNYIWFNHYNHFIFISFHEQIMCCFFFSFLEALKIWGQTRQAEKAPVFCSAGKATATSSVSKDLSKKNPLTNWKSWMFLESFLIKIWNLQKREYLMTLSTYMDYILDAYCMQWTNGLEVNSKKNERNNYIL